MAKITEVTWTNLIGNEIKFSCLPNSHDFLTILLLSNPTLGLR